MAEDVEVKLENPCCAAWKKKCAELKQRCSLFKEYKQEVRVTTSMVQKKFDELEKDKESLKKDKESLEEVLRDLKTRWKNEKEMESGIRIDLENEVSDLKDEIQELKQKGNATSEEADGELKKRLDVAEEEMNRMKDCLEKEKERANLERKNAELQKKKAGDALKKAEKEKNRASEAQWSANIERKKAEENMVMLEKLKTEIDTLKSTERSKSEAADKRVEAEKQKTNREKKKAESAMAKAEEQRKLAETNLEKAKFQKDRADALNRKLEEERTKVKKLEEDALKSTERSKSETTADKKVEVEKQKTNREKKKAESAMAKAEEQRKLAETNLEKVKFEKDRTDALNRKLEEERTKVKKLEEELREHICAPNTGKIAELTTDICTGTVINDATTSQWAQMLLEEDQNIIMEKKRADSETMKAKKHEKVAEEHRRMAIEQKQRADRLSRELKGYKLRLKELGKEPQELLSYRLNNADVSQRGNNNVIYENERVKLLKKELKLEKMLVKHAKKATKLEVLRNNMLHQELLHLKQECLRFQQRLDVLDDSFLNDGEGIHELEKMGNQAFTRHRFYSDQSHGQLTSGIDPRLNHPCRGSKRNILQSSALNSSSASISDQTLVGPPKSSTFFAMTSAKGEKIRSPIRGNSNESTAKRSDMRIILDAFASVENTCSKGQKLNQQVSEKLSQLHGLLNEPTTEVLQENSCQKHVRTFKRRKTSCDGAIVIHPLHESGDLIPHSDDSDACASPVIDVMELDQRILVSKQCIPTESDDVAIYDYMKLLELDNPAHEESYRIAIARPLSPTLPDIEFHGDEGPTNLVLNDVVTSQLQREDESVACLNNTGVLQAGHSHVHQIGNEEKKKSCEKSVLLRYCVISSDNNDVNSLLRILQTIRSCMPQCSLLDSPDLFLRNLLMNLNAEDISMKERVCAFFCIIIHRVSEVGTRKLTNALSSEFVQFLASITLPIRSALFDLALRKLFMESCDLHELLALVEDFLGQRKVLVCAEVSGKTHTLHNPKLNLDLNGNAISVYELPASAHQLVIVCSLLASICSGVDHIGLVCEISCNIFSMDKFDPVMSLGVLHAFAHTCGSKYFALHDYTLAMTVVKSLVVYLEKQTLLAYSSSQSETLSEVWSCNASCPFSESALSVEDVASLLVNKLQVYGRSVSWMQGSSKGRKDGDSGPTEAVLLSNGSDEKLFSFMDILSLVEILASLMGWEWTNVNFVGQFCELSGSCLTEDSSAAIIILLCQLGRLGVVASGYESTGVEELRERLSAFLQHSNFSKLSLVTQFALMTALLGLTPIKLEQIVQSTDETTLALSKSIDANFVKKWFSLLSNEQQSVLGLQHCDSETSYTTRFLSGLVFAGSVC